MKLIHPHLILSATILSLPLLIISCNSKKETAQTESTQTDETKAPQNDIKPYPLKTCLVSGDTLGAMGKPIVVIHQGQELKFCCKPCIPKFKANPAKYLARLQPGHSDHATQANHHHGTDNHDDQDHDNSMHSHGDTIKHLDNPFDQNSTTNH